ncbi:hypothetical protein [Fodinicola feengrottensis]
MVASALLATVAFGLGSLASWLLPPLVRQIAAGVVLVGFAVADLAAKTPHIWRQVPVQYLKTMPPGKLGVVWGFDLSLLFTTQKSTSLTWAALTGLVLLAPSASWLTLCGMTTVGVLTIVGRSILFQLRRPSLLGDFRQPWFHLVRRTTGVALVGVAVYIALGA